MEYIDFNWKAFAKELMRKRNMLSMSQSDLEKRTGVSRVTICRVEQGKGCRLNAGVALAYFLDIQLFKFILDNEGREEEPKLPFNK